MSDLLQLMVSGGASDLHVRVGVSHHEDMMRFHRNPLLEAKDGLPKDFRFTLFPGQKDKLIKHAPSIGGVKK